MEYTATEYADMIIVYGAAGENARAAARLYAERFPGREHPSYHVILRCVQRLRETGSVMRDQRRIGAPMRLAINEEAMILRAFEEDPRSSVRRVARRLGFSRRAVYDTVRRNGLHPFHHQRVQQLLPGDEVQRMHFCQGICIIFIQ